MAKNDSNFNLCVGYAGWEAGQLESELDRDSWLYTDLNSELVFDVPIDERHDRAMEIVERSRI